MRSLLFLCHTAQERGRLSPAPFAVKEDEENRKQLTFQQQP